MIRASLAALALSCSFGAVAAAQESDPYLWLEDIEGEKALGWVKKHPILVVLVQNDQFVGTVGHGQYVKRGLSEYLH